MIELLIKTKDGTVYKENVLMHFMIVDKHDIDHEDIEDVGFISKGREIWVNRKPH